MKVTKGVTQISLTKEEARVLRELYEFYMEEDTFEDPDDLDIFLDCILSSYSHFKDIKIVYED